MGIFKKDSAEKSRFTNPEDVKINEDLTLIFNSMKEKGYDPYNQLIWYLYSEDEKLITVNKDARRIITSYDRDVLMSHILRTYFGG